MWFLLSVLTCWIGWEVNGCREGSIWVYGIREKIVVWCSLRKCEKKKEFILLRHCFNNRPDTSFYSWGWVWWKSRLLLLMETCILKSMVIQGSNFIESSTPEGGMTHNSQKLFRWIFLTSSPEMSPLPINKFLFIKSQVEPWKSFHFFVSFLRYVGFVSYPVSLFPLGGVTLAHKRHLKIHKLGYRKIRARKTDHSR